MAGSEVSRFLERVAPFRQDWQSLDVRFVAEQATDGVWHLRGLRALTFPYPPENLARVVGPNFDGFCSEQHVLPPHALDDLLRQAETGKFALGEKEILCVEDAKRPLSLSSFFTPGKDGEMNARVGGHHSLGAQTNRGYIHAQRSRDDLDQRLRDQDPPWEGIEDVFRDFLGFSEPGSIGWQTGDAGLLAFEALVYTGVWMRNIAFEKDHFEIRLRIESTVDPKRISVASFERSKAFETRRRRINLSGAPGGSRDVVVVVPIKPETEFFVATASYGGCDAGRQEKVIPGSRPENIRVQVVDHLLAGKDVMQEGILDPAKRGRDLEPWLVLLFYELGFFAARTDGLGPKEATIDVLVTGSEVEIILLVECSEAAPDTNGKLRKLVVRFHELDEAVLADIFPVLVTRLPESAIPQTDRETAGREGIALVARESLTRLHELARKGVGQREVVEFLDQLIPQNPGSESYSRVRRHSRFAGLI